MCISEIPSKKKDIILFKLLLYCYTHEVVKILKD